MRTTLVHAGRAASPGARAGSRGRSGSIARLLLVALSVLALAACGGSAATSQPTAPPATIVAASPAAASPAPVASEMPSAPTSLTPSPTIAPGSTLGPTSSTATVTIPVVGCPAWFGGEGTLPSPPSTGNVTLPSDVAREFSLYGMDKALILAPKGWKCSGGVGMDGSFEVKIADPADALATVSVVGAIGADRGYILRIACPFFADAAKTAEQDFPGIVTCSVPSGERVVRVDETDVEFVDAPGVTGTGDGSGSAYAVSGIVHYDGKGASKVSCALPPASMSLCQPILDAFVRDPS